MVDKKVAPKVTPQVIATPQKHKPKVIDASKKAEPKVVTPPEKVEPKKVEPKIVSAVGSTSPLGRGVRGNMIEHVMNQAVHAASAEAKAIWEQTDIELEEKQKRIAAIMDPQAILKRKLDARQKAKDEYRALEAKLLK